DITNDVTISGVAAHPPTGRYIMTPVHLSRPSLLSIGLTGVWGLREVVPLAHVRGDREQLYRRGRAIFEASRLDASAAAARDALRPERTTTLDGMRTRARAGAILLLGAALVLAVHTASPQECPVAPCVSVPDSGYDPPSVTINGGQRVFWENHGTTNHSVTAD